MSDADESLSVMIERFEDDHFPCFVQCLLAVEKGPVVSTANLSSDSVYFQTGHVACVVQDEWIEKWGRKMARVSTQKPWGFGSVAGETNFVVLREQIVRGLT
jgi:hypothetical protein